MARGSKNMVNYLLNCMKPFEEEPFNEVDSLICSWLSYLHYPEEIIPKNEPKFHDFIEVFRAEHFEHMLHEVWSPEEALKLLGAVIASPRFRGVQFGFHRSEIEHKSGKQFSAVTFRIRPNLYYVAYRGTDWSLTGWEEDCNLALKEPIPSQRLAKEYLVNVGKMLTAHHSLSSENAPDSLRFIVGGHSKGGNLAVYAAANCELELQNRIQDVYTHDGPGFLEEDLEKEGFQRIQGRIHKTAPQFSIFGMLFKQEVEPKIINSNETGIMQHNPISWETGEYELVERRRGSRAARRLDNKLNNWIDGISYEERELFITTLFDLLESTGATSFDELVDHMGRNLPVIYKALRRLDPEMQRFMRDLLKQLITASDEEDSE